MVNNKQKLKMTKCITIIHFQAKKLKTAKQIIIIKINNKKK